jgi:hypothetical protein
VENCENPRRDNYTAEGEEKQEGSNETQDEKDSVQNQEERVKIDGDKAGGGHDRGGDELLRSVAVVTAVTITFVTISSPIIIAGGRDLTSRTVAGVVTAAVIAVSVRISTDGHHLAGSWRNDGSSREGMVTDVRRLEGARKTQLAQDTTGTRYAHLRQAIEDVLSLEQVEGAQEIEGPEKNQKGR